MFKSKSRAARTIPVGRVLACVAALIAGLHLAFQSPSIYAAPQSQASSTVRGAGSFGAVKDVVQQRIDAGEIPGAVILVARDGKIVYHEAQGIMDPETKAPFQKDTVFWLASMTKTVAAVATLMMVEEGKLALSDPVWKYVPEFKNTRVRVLKPGVAPPPRPAVGVPNTQPAVDETQYYDYKPADRDITVRHLLTHTSGLMSIGVPNAAAPIRKPMEPLASFVSKLGSVPLDFEPGTNWAYSNIAGLDVAGRLVEIVSGQSFERFVQQRIFDPLGMKSMSLAPVPEALMRRLAPQLRRTNTGFERIPDPDYITYVSAAAGAVGTAEDYWKCAQMLLDGGVTPNGKRLLKAETVTAMRSNQTLDIFPGTATEARYQRFGAKGMGHGFGVLTVLDPVAAGLDVPAGSFGWDGQSTTRYWVMPRERVVLVMLMRPNGSVVWPAIEKAVKQTLNLS